MSDFANILGGLVIVLTFWLCVLVWVYTSRVLALREVIETCAEQFEMYAGAHWAKQTVEADVKARTNERYAGMCRKALENTK